MSFKRREFLKSLLLLGPLFHTLQALAKKAGNQRAVSSIEADTRVPILQGATNANSAQISVMSNQKISFAVLTPEGEKTKANVKVETATQANSAWVAYHLQVTRLEAGKNYQLVVHDSADRVIDTRTFSTLNPAQKNFRVALASCMRDTKAEQAGMWAALAASKPDLLCLLGDNVYVDDGPSGKENISREKIWKRYVETRTTLDLYKLPVLIPSIATWDDHDFGLNNTYGKQSWTDYSTEIFRTLYPQLPTIAEVSKGPGVATAFSAFGHRFFFMDCRSFRSMRYIGVHHWGEGQEEWLFGELAKNDQPAWLFNGSQFFGGYRSGWSFEGTQYRRFMKVLNKVKKLSFPVVFGSGDVHYSEIMKIEQKLLGYETYEITSSSMHSNDKGERKGNKRRIASTGKYNFVVADVRAIADGMEMDLTSIGYGSTELFQLKNLKIVK